MDLDAFLKQLTALGDDFLFHAAPPPEPRRVRHVENKLPAKLLPEHRVLIQRYGALAIVAKEEGWPRPAEFDVRPAWHFAHELVVVGVVPRDHARSLDVRTHVPAGRKKIVPAIRFGGETYGYDSKGEMFVWSKDDSPRPHTTPRFYPALSTLVATLAKNATEMKAWLATSEPVEEEPAITPASILARLASTDPEVRASAAGDGRKLDAFPPAVVDGLVRALADDDQSVRIAAAESLEWAKSPKAVEPLLALLPRAKAHPRWFRRAEVGASLRTLAVSGPNDPRVVAAIVPFLFVPEQPYASLAAFEALRALGKHGRAALPALRSIDDESNVWKRAQAHFTMLAIEGKAERHIGALFGLLASDSEKSVEFVLEDAVTSLGARALPLLRAQKGHRALVRKLVRAIETLSQ